MPIVFVQVIDRVGGGFVDNLAKPGGNVTEFMQYEYAMSGKWLELLKEIVPQPTRVGVVVIRATPLRSVSSPPSNRLHRRSE